MAGENIVPELGTDRPRTVALQALTSATNSI